MSKSSKKLEKGIDSQDRNSRKGAGRRRAVERAATPACFDSLEARQMFSATAKILDGQLRVTGDDVGSFITVDHAGTTTTVGAQTFNDADITKGILIDAGKGNDTVNILGTVKAVTVNGTAGSDNVNVGKAGSLAGVQADVMVKNDLGLTALTINDSTDATAQTVTLDVANGMGTVKGMGPTISYLADDLRSLTVLAGKGGNTINVLNTAVFQDLTKTTTVRSGQGKDVVNVLGTTGALTVDLQGTASGQADSVAIGNAGKTQGIAGAVAVMAGSGYRLVVDDSSDDAGRTVTFAGNVQAGNTISGLGATITYGGPTVLNAGFVTSATVTVRTGSGADNALVRGMPANLFLDTGSGDDTVSLGSAGNNMDGIFGTLDVTAGGGVDALNYNDQATTGARSYVLDTFNVSRPNTTFTRFDSNLERLNLNAGAFGNTIEIKGTGATEKTTVNSGAGSDKVAVRRLNNSGLVVNGQAGQDAVTVGQNGSVQNIVHPLNVFNGLGRTALVVDDSADTTARTVTMDAGGLLGTIVGLAPATITYDVPTLASVTALGGKGGNTVDILNTATGSFPVPTIVRTGTGIDRVHVLGTTGALQLDLQGDGGTGNSDFVIVGDKNGFGNTGHTQNIKGSVNVTGSEFFVVDVDDSGSSVGHNNVVVTANGVSGLSPGAVTLSGPAGSDRPFNLTLLASQGDDVINVRSAPKGENTLFMAARGGNDTFNFGSSADQFSTLGQIASRLITADGEEGNDTINFNDQGSTTPETYATVDVDFSGGDSIDETQFAHGTGLVTVRAESMAINGGSGGNTFNLAGRIARNVGGVMTTVNSGTGADVVNVIRSGAAMTINGQNGSDVVNIGNNGSVQGILGRVTVTNIFSRSSLRVDDSADPIGRTATLRGPADFGTITGLAPAEIRYRTQDVNAVTVRGGSGGNTFTVDGTVDNFVKPTTSLITGSGADTVNVLATTGALAIEGLNGKDIVNIGLNDSVQSIKGKVSVANLIGSTTLNLNDRADTVARNVTMDVKPDQFLIPIGTVTGLAPAEISYRPVNLGALNVNGGSGGNTFTVNNTAKNNFLAVTTLNSGSGNDTVLVRGTTGPLNVHAEAGVDKITIGSVFNTLDTIQGPVLADAGDSGFDLDLLTVNDQGSTTPHTYTFAPFTIDRSGAARITFAGIELAQINQGPKAVVNNAPAAKNLKLSKSVKVGEAATLTGQLVDPDKADVLTLTVNWGDGSKVETSKPGLKPFSLSHKYAKAGKYTVRVTWTDKLGASNHQDLKLEVTPASKPPKSLFSVKEVVHRSEE
jgi:hypothetical protein